MQQLRLVFEGIVTENRILRNQQIVCYISSPYTCLIERLRLFDECLSLFPLGCFHVLSFSFYV